MTTTEDHCPERVHPAGSFIGHPCGRPVKDEGLCGLHLAAKRRRKANDEERRQRWAKLEVAGKRAQELVERFRDELALPASPGPDGGVVLSEAVALKLLELYGTRGRE